MAKVNKKEFEGFKDTEMNLIDGRTLKIGDYFLPNDFFPSKDRKDVYVKYEGLARVIRKLFVIKSYIPCINQTPLKSNDWCATVTTNFVIVPVDDFTKQLEIGSSADCRSNTASQGFGNYTTALAETRAKARAFRDILGLPMCSVEEVSDEADIIDKTLDDPIENQIVMLIEKKFLQQLGKTMEDVSEIVGRPITSLEQLSKGEGGKVISTINKQGE